MSKKVCVIGSDPGGYRAAVKAAKLGAQVTVIEKDLPGGVCVNWGCIPTKALLSSGKLFKQFQRAREYGIELQGSVQPEITQIMNRKDKIVQNQRKAIQDLFNQNNIEFIQGRARIQDNNNILVQTSNQEEFKIFWDKLILATGSRPIALPDHPFDGEQIISSDRAVQMQEIPSRVLVLGGGVVGCEYACMLRDLGAEVILVEALSRLLPFSGLDPEISKVLQREIKKKKISLKTNTIATELQQSATGIRVKLQPREDSKPAYEDVEKVLVCIGRKSNIEELGLENLGINTLDRDWIQVDANLQTNVEGVYAIGDALGPQNVMLAHVATAEGEIAAENALGSEKKMSYSAVPAAIFTHPEVAYAGISESEAREAGRHVETESMFYRELGKAQATGEIAGQVKIVFDSGNQQLLGVNIIGEQATELIGEAALAIQTGRNIREISETIHAHPTLSEIIWEVAKKARNK